jgi:hypothetical protein
MDFVHDAMVDGRRFRILSVVNDYACVIPRDKSVDRVGRTEGRQDVRMTETVKGPAGSFAKTLRLASVVSTASELPRARQSNGSIVLFDC